MELDHSLVPENIQDINEQQDRSIHLGRTPKYEVVKKNIMEIVAEREKENRKNQEQREIRKKKLGNYGTTFEEWKGRYIE